MPQIPPDYVQRDYAPTNNYAPECKENKKLISTEKQNKIRSAVSTLFDSKIKNLNENLLIQKMLLAILQLKPWTFEMFLVVVDKYLTYL